MNKLSIYNNDRQSNRIQQDFGEEKNKNMFALKKLLSILNVTFHSAISCKVRVRTPLHRWWCSTVNNALFNANVVGRSFNATNTVCQPRCTFNFSVI